MKYTPETAKQCPTKDLKQVYDTNDRVLFGSKFIKGKVAYNYIPGELMESGVPHIVSTSISYDGKGNVDLPKGSLIMSFSELPKMFTENQFG